MVTACGDQYVRVFDRRMASSAPVSHRRGLRKENNPCIYELSPGYLWKRGMSTFRTLPKEMEGGAGNGGKGKGRWYVCNDASSIMATYAEFSPDGSEVLATYSGENIYRFQVNGGGPGEGEEGDGGDGGHNDEVGAVKNTKKMSRGSDRTSKKGRQKPNDVAMIDKESSHQSSCEQKIGTGVAGIGDRFASGKIVSSGGVDSIHIELFYGAYRDLQGIRKWRDSREEGGEDDQGKKSDRDGDTVMAERERGRHQNQGGQYEHQWRGDRKRRSNSKNSKAKRRKTLDGSDGQRSGCGVIRRGETVEREKRGEGEEGREMNTKEEAMADGGYGGKNTAISDCDREEEEGKETQQSDSDEVKEEGMKAVRERDEVDLSGPIYSGYTQIEEYFQYVLAVFRALSSPMRRNDLCTQPWIIGHLSHSIFLLPNDMALRCERAMACLKRRWYGDVAMAAWDCEWIIHKEPDNYMVGIDNFMVGIDNYMVGIDNYIMGIDISDLPLAITSLLSSVLCLFHLSLSVSLLCLSCLSNSPPSPLSLSPL